jgi:hypothetical protein
MPSGIPQRSDVGALGSRAARNNVERWHDDAGLEGTRLGRPGPAVRKGYIDDPKGKAKSVVLTEEGRERAETLFVHLFGLPEYKYSATGNDDRERRS